MANERKITRVVREVVGGIKKIGQKMGKVLCRKPSHTSEDIEKTLPRGEHIGSTTVAATESSSRALNRKENKSNVLVTSAQASRVGTRDYSTGSQDRVKQARQGTQRVASKQASHGTTIVQQQALSSRLESAQLNRSAMSTIPGSLPPNQLPHGAGSRTFAFVIGIDKYRSSRKPRLQGAVNDAYQMYWLLQTVFGVPKANISLLCDHQATRDRIIAGFKALINNPNIQRGDAIVIYFAGHGSQAPAPADWNVEGGMVETLCPVDEEFRTEGPQIHGIPDRTVAALIHNIYNAKGGNITLIFDCCHSGGLARGNAPKQRRRFAPTSAPIPSGLDDDILVDAPQSRGGAQRKGFSAALSKYVLLAACRPSEQAKEAMSEDGNPCGAFSNILFRHLRASEPATTYLDIARSTARDLVSYFQHPLCEGEHKNRPLFNGMTVRQDNKLFNVTRDEKGIVSVDAGSAHGITLDSLFNICEFDARSGSYKERGVMGTQTITVGSSVLKNIGGRSFVPPKHCRATILSWGSSNDLLQVFSQDIPTSWIERTPQHYPRYHVTSTPSKSALVLRSSGPKEIAFDRGFPISQYTKDILRPRVKFNPQSTRSALNEIGDFHFHLLRSNRARQYPLMDQVKLRIHRLAGNATITGQDLFNNRRADVKAGVDFGFTIVNESHLDLYAYLFFFDGSDFSIQKWYHPPAYNMAPPLPSNKGVPSVLHIGFPDHSSAPFFFTIPKGAKSDVGFLKLFVSTCAIDMDNLVQESPFAKAAGNEGTGSARPSPYSRGGGQRARSVHDLWDTSCYVVNIHQ